MRQYQGKPQVYLGVRLIIGYLEIEQNLLQKYIPYDSYGARQKEDILSATTTHKGGEW